MLSRMLYYIVIKPLSLLPLWILYRISDLGYVIIYHLVGYRKKVVQQNLTRSFPDKNEKEIRDITSKFYHHFCDLVVESIRLFSISKEEALRRCICRNPELMNQYFPEHRSVVIGCGHYNSWELLGVAFDPQVLHQTLCPYTPLSDAYMDQKMRVSRSKYGARVVDKNHLKAAVERHAGTPTVVVFGTDQNPSSRSKKLYWTRFLNQDTAVNFGMEKYAKDYNLPVFFMNVYKMKRGYYEYEFELITDNPQAEPYGAITDAHTRILEQQIIETPEYWLWTHKRWKRKREPQENE